MENSKNAALNGGRGSGQTVRRIAAIYEAKIADLKANFDYVLEGKENEYRAERKKLCDEFENMKAGLESQIAELKETLAETIENDEVGYETLKLHDEEEIGMLNSRVAELEKLIEKMKKGIGLMRELLTALKIYGAKYNVSLIADADKFLCEVEI